MAGRAQRYSSQLSGGEQQRVCIARALAKQVDVMLCDEPTGALDTENSRQIMKIFCELSRKRGQTVVIITHNPALTLAADRSIVMSNGRILSDTINPFPIAAERIA